MLGDKERLTIKSQDINKLFEKKSIIAGALKNSIKFIIFKRLLDKAAWFFLNEK